uniref:Uncharacterized protein n=1 Tax=Oryza sativa subsp. japonica TaxID=39947 RepID=Q8H5J2_ORYSJ|nr:hypothetical protein [Oryza sativa Japonica Group]
MATRDRLLFEVHLAGELLVGGGRNQVLGGRRWSSKGSRIWRFRRQRRRCTDGDASTTIPSDRQVSPVCSSFRYSISKDLAICSIFRMFYLPREKGVLIPKGISDKWLVSCCPSD